jgi:TPR repeat protein
MAAERGDPLGQANLGVAYANAQGVKRDFVQAYAWYTLAIENFPKVDHFGRDRALKNRNVIEQLMSSEEMAKAKLVIANFKNK